MNNIYLFIFDLFHNTPSNKSVFRSSMPGHLPTLPENSACRFSPPCACVQKSGRGRPQLSSLFFWFCFHYFSLPLYIFFSHSKPFVHLLPHSATTPIIVGTTTADSGSTTITTEQLSHVVVVVSAAAAVPSHSVNVVLPQNANERLQTAIDSDRMSGGGSGGGGANSISVRPKRKSSGGRRSSTTTTRALSQTLQQIFQQTTATWQSGGDIADRRTSLSVDRPAADATTPTLHTVRGPVDKKHRSAAATAQYKLKPASTSKTGGGSSASEIPLHEIVQENQVLVQNYVAKLKNRHTLPHHQRGRSAVSPLIMTGRPFYSRQSSIEERPHATATAQLSLHAATAAFCHSWDNLTGHSVGKNQPTGGTPHGKMWSTNGAPLNKRTTAMIAESPIFGGSCSNIQRLSKTLNAAASAASPMSGRLPRPHRTYQTFHGTTMSKGGAAAAVSLGTRPTIQLLPLFDRGATAHSTFEPFTDYNCYSDDEATAAAALYDSDVITDASDRRSTISTQSLDEADDDDDDDNDNDDNEYDADDNADYYGHEDERSSSTSSQSFNIVHTTSFSSASKTQRCTTAQHGYPFGRAQIHASASMPSVPAYGRQHRRRHPSGRGHGTEQPPTVGATPFDAKRDPRRTDASGSAEQQHSPFRPHAGEPAKLFMIGDRHRYSGRRQRPTAQQHRDHRISANSRTVPHSRTVSPQQQHYHQQQQHPQHSSPVASRAVTPTTCMRPGQMGRRNTLVPSSLSASMMYMVGDAQPQAPPTMPPYYHHYHHIQPTQSVPSLWSADGHMQHNNYHTHVHSQPPLPYNDYDPQSAAYDYEPPPPLPIQYQAQQHQQQQHNAAVPLNQSLPMPWQNLVRTRPNHPCTYTHAYTLMQTRSRVYIYTYKTGRNSS